MTESNDTANLHLSSGLTEQAAPPLSILDGALALVSVVIAVAVTLHIGNSDGPAQVTEQAAEAGIALSLAAAALGGCAMLFARRHPVPVLLTVTACRLLMTWDVGSELALAPATAVVFYLVARSGDRRTRLTVALLTAVVSMTVIAALDDEPFVPEFLGEGAQMFLAIAVGDGVRSRAERLRDKIEAEATARVQAERLRIARDLHDVVAHGLSTIAVQSGVAAHLLDRKPEQAREALEIINRTGKDSLEELRTMVGVLRSTDEAPLLPTPTDPNDLSDLMNGATDAGLMVSLAVDGMFPADVGDSCVVAMHRIIQEALTNVTHHAGVAAADLDIEHGPDQVQVTITNRIGTEQPEVASTGVGIIGMTERAEALGGTLQTVVSDKQFRVIATIPYHPRH